MISSTTPHVPWSAGCKARAQVEATVTKSIPALTLILSTAALVAAQTPDPPQAQKPTQETVTTTVTTTLVGCLYKEDQIPGRTPNVAERAGILEDYILADATMKTDQAKGAATGTSGTLPASGGIYKIEKIADEKLKALVGKKVEVTGRIDPQRAQAPGRPGSATGAPTPDVGPSPDRINLPEFEASSIREISGQCPAKPTMRQ